MSLVVEILPVDVQGDLRDYERGGGGKSDTFPSVHFVPPGLAEPRSSPLEGCLLDT